MPLPGEKPKKPDLDVTQAAPGEQTGDQTIEAPTPAPSSSPRSIAPRPMITRPVHRPDGMAFDKPAAPGEVGMLGPYQIIKELGHGGMGAVYLANDTRLQRKLALKVMLPRFAAQPAAKERFLREARAAAQISHDNVVTVYEADERNGVPYIAMQFLKGTSLDDYLTRKGNLAIGPVLRVGREAAQGLAAAHKIGLVHRDIKPGNLWLEAPNGRLKVLDFGLAKPLDSDVELTTSGMLVGTPVYMSPEQARGHQVDGRSDLFSLGGVLYRLCSGQLPFAGNTTMALLMALGTEDPKPLQALNPEVPTALAELIHQMLEKNPENRPQNADEVVRRLRAIAEEFLSPRATVDINTTAAAVASFPDQPIAISTLSSAPSGMQLVSGLVQKKLPQKVIWGVAALAAVTIGGIAFVVKQNDNTSTKPDLAGAIIPRQAASNQNDAASPTDDSAATQTEKDFAATTQPQYASIPKPDVKSMVAPTVPQPDSKPAVTSTPQPVAPTPPPVQTSTPTVDADRIATDWILSVGGRLQANNVTEIFSAQGIPKGRFTLTRAFLFQNPNTTDDSIGHLSGLTGLTTIMIDDTHVSDKGIASLKNLLSLVCLDARGTQVTGSSLVNFKDVKSFIGANLDGGATDDGMAGVAACKSLRYLNLQSRRITDAGLATLRALPDLQRIDLKKSKVTLAGIADFHTALPACRVEYDGGIIDAGASPNRSTIKPTKMRDISEWVTSPDYVWTEPRPFDNELKPNSSQSDVNVRLDGLELWYATTQGENGDLWVSRRKSIDAPWSPAVNAGPQINSKSWDASPHLSADGLVLVFWRFPDFRFFQSSRTSLQAPWSPAVELQNTINLYTPALSPDGLELFATYTGGNLKRMTRPTRRAAFQNATSVNELNDGTNLEVEWISPDSKTLMLQSGKDGPPIFYLAKRPAPGKPFQTDRTPLELPGPPHSLEHPYFLMTPSGLDLYFRRDGKLHISHRVPKGTDTRTPDRRAAELILALGGKVEVNGKPEAISRIEDLPGDFVLTKVVLFANKASTDGDMDEICRATGVTELFLYGTQTSDRGMQNFKNLKNLITIDLGGTPVSDAGLDQIRGLPGLKSLYLHQTRVSASGLKNLPSFPALEILNVTGIVDDAGLASIARATKLQTIYMGQARISDAGLMQLQTLKQLRLLSIKNTQISAEGAQKLHTALPRSRIEYDGGVITAAE